MFGPRPGAKAAVFEGECAKLAGRVVPRKRCPPRDSSASLHPEYGLETRWPLHCVRPPNRQFGAERRHCESADATEIARGRTRKSFASRRLMLTARCRAVTFRPTTSSCPIAVVQHPLVLTDRSSRPRFVRPPDAVPIALDVDGPAAAAAAREISARFVGLEQHVGDFEFAISHPVSTSIG